MPMIPPKNDPRWKNLVLDDQISNFQALPTKMLMMRVRILARDKTPQKVEEAIEIAYDFFSKNSNIVVNDIALLFGDSEKGDL
jgi:hypothetical protein